MFRDSILSFEIWQRVKFFYLRTPRTIISSPLETIWISHSYLGPQPIWISPSLYWKTLFVKLYKDSILSLKSDNVLSTSISKHLER